MHSFIDRRTHEFLFEKNYPDVKVMHQLVRLLSHERPSTREQMAQTTGQEADVVEAVLDKLWIHGGAELDGTGQVFRGKPNWEASYLRQRKHRALQLLQVAQFAEAKSCRMRLLVENFGDRDGNDQGCGQCDVCRPRSSPAVDVEELPSNREFDRRLLAALTAHDRQAAGKLFRESFETQGIERSQFEHRLELLAGRNIVKITANSFCKDGRWVEVRTFQHGRLYVHFDYVRGLAMKTTLEADRKNWTIEIVTNDRGRSAEHWIRSLRGQDKPKLAEPDGDHEVSV